MSANSSPLIKSVQKRKRLKGFGLFKRKEGVIQWHNKWIMDANMGVRKPPLVHPQPANSKNIVCGLSLLLFCRLFGHSVTVSPVTYSALTGLSPTTFSSQLVNLPLCRESVCRFLTSLVICHFGAKAMSSYLLTSLDNTLLLSNQLIPPAVLFFLSSFFKETLTR